MVLLRGDMDNNWRKPRKIKLSKDRVRQMRIKLEAIEGALHNALHDYFLKEELFTQLSKAEGWTREIAEELGA